MGGLLNGHHLMMVASGDFGVTKRIPNEPGISAATSTLDVREYGERVQCAEGELIPRSPSPALENVF